MQRDNNTHKIKIYGQVFSGNKIAKLLVSMLPHDYDVKTIIDPMVGSGDLLQAAIEKFPNADKITGIDIDGDVIAKCKERLSNANIINEDAFVSKELNVEGGWDLVITNPPYIRYQTLKNNHDFGLPDGADIRRNLIKQIEESVNIKKSERELFLGISQGYSGLSDMAVPSLILCASIVKTNGYLAMVVPDTWLNRNYALPIHYLLLKGFEIVAIARDVESAWFDGAEVRTCLIICRKKTNEPINSAYRQTVFIDIKAECENSDSLVGNMIYSGKKDYEALNSIITTKASCNGKGYSSRSLNSIDLFPGFLDGIMGKKWVLVEDKTRRDACVSLPIEIKDIVKDHTDVSYESLSELKWEIGQGLRTGANDFFYATEVSCEGKNTTIQTEPWYGKRLNTNNDNLKKALKKRGDVRGVFVSYKDLSKCIIYIHNLVRKSDCKKLAGNLKAKYRIMDSEMADYVTAGENYTLPSKNKAFNELSAVRTNVKRTTEGVERFWYMLPELKERHKPSICISRICGEKPDVLFIEQKSDKEIVVDANFITLWSEEVSTYKSIFALLNSTWVKAYLELVGTTMGGGALKLEASQIRRILIPKLSANQKDELDKIGTQILLENNISNTLQNRIDNVVFSVFNKSEEVYGRILELYIQKKQERLGRSNDEQR